MGESENGNLIWATRLFLKQNVSYNEDTINLHNIYSPLLLHRIAVMLISILRLHLSHKVVNILNKSQRGWFSKHLLIIDATLSSILKKFPLQKPVWPFSQFSNTRNWFHTIKLSLMISGHSPSCSCVRSMLKHGSPIT